MSDVTPTIGATITVGDFELSSSSETAEQMREVVKSVRPIKGRPGDNRAKDAASIDSTHVDEGGKSHDAAGKFKGNGEPETLDAAATAKKEKDKEAEAERKKTAQSRIQDLASKKNEEAKAREAAERRAEAAERRAAEAEAKLKAPREEPRPVPKVEAKVEGETPKRRFPKTVEEFGPTEELETWNKYNEARDEWVLSEAEKAVEARYTKRTETEQREKAMEARAEQLRQQSEAGDAAIKAKGPEWLASVKSVTDKLVPRFMVPDGQPITAMNGLTDYVILHGDKIPDVLEYLRDNPEHIQRFEEIVRSPPERQPFMFERELGYLAGSLMSVLKASATAGNPEPRALPEPRAKTPVQPVAGSPNAVEADLSNVSDLDKYLRKLPAERRAQILRRR